MPETELEKALRNFDRLATPVRRRAERSVWRFEFHDRPYYLVFHPRRSGLTRLFRTGSALSEFFNLQAMQKADIPAPRAVAHLSGFRVEGELGDAVIVEAIPDAVPLETLIRDQNPPPGIRRGFVSQVVGIVNGIGGLKLGHRDLGLRSFLVAGSKLYFHDSSRLRSGGMRMNDILRLGHDASRFSTRGELIRGWNGIEPDHPVPDRNALSPSIWKQLVRSSREENDDFGRLRIGEWSGHFVRTSRLARPWSTASRLQISEADWQAAWPVLLAQLESGQLETIKRDPSGEVLQGEVVLAGRAIRIIVKRPRQKIWWRAMLDRLRPSRASRTWDKAWMIIARNLPCEWPMLLMERGGLLQPVESVLVFERVPGERLDRIDLSALTPTQRETLFHRAGTILRKLEETGLLNYDPKSTNWIIYPDPASGPSPIMLDCYGIRPLNFFMQGWAIRRLLRAMRNHKQYTPTDSLALCRGFVPFAGRFEREEPEPSK